MRKADIMRNRDESRKLAAEKEVVKIEESGKIEGPVVHEAIEEIRVEESGHKTKGKKGGKSGKNK